ncbi:hypothetical protein EOL70_12790 [Leucothrix sargassi]|nr:hypothetical protein EOL70_12790 [Leucothrix sargassi]
MSVSSFEPVKVEPCKNCGYPMKQFNPNSMMMTCESCGTKTGETQPPAYIPRVPVNPLFKLHESFQFKGNTWQVIGCQTYRGSVREWDSEDSAWEETPWSYYTWWVINSSRQLAWVVQDKTGYFWSRKDKVKGPIPENDQSYERGSWTMTSAVGEFSYFPTENERVISYEKAGHSIEVALDEQGRKQEIEAFASEPIDEMALLEGFQKKETLEGIKRLGLLFKVMIACIFCLAIGYFGMKSLETKLIDMPAQRLTQASVNQEIDMGTISIDQSSLVEFSFRASLQSSDGMFDADLLIKDSDNALVTELPVEFWRESGRDSDGYWTESQSGDSPRIKLPAGKNYQLSLKPASFTNWTSIDIRGTVTRNVVSTFPIIIALLLLVLMLILMGRKKSKYIQKSIGLR